MKVLMFQQWKAEKIVAGLSRQTIRPVRKRPIKVGDQLSLRFWSGKPYRSTQVEIGMEICKKTAEIKIHGGPFNPLVYVAGEKISKADLEEIATADGFDSAEKMLEWFQSTHGLPFVGTIYQW